MLTSSDHYLSGNAAWWQESVIYRVFLPRFGDGLDGLQGLIDTVPYLSELLNVDALWISPASSVPSPIGTVDARPADLAVLERLVAEAHVRGLRVIVDDTLRDREQAESLGSLRSWLEQGIDGIAIDPTSEHQQGLLPQTRALLAEYGDRMVILDSASTVADSRVRDRSSRAEEAGLAASHMILDGPLTSEAVAATIVQLDEQASVGRWPVNQVGGQGRPRVSSRLGDAGARLAALLLMTLPGTPTIYGGDELGLADTRTARASADCFPCAAGAGQPSTAQVPWSVERQLRDPGSMLTLYRRLIDLHRLRPPLRTGAVQHLSVDPDGCLVLERRWGESGLVIALNLTARERTVALPCAQPRVLVSTAIVPPSEVSGSDLVLGGHVGVVVECT